MNNEENYKRGWLKRHSLVSDKITLYKFFPYHANSLGPLICGGLYFSKASNFNDPFDCNFKMLPTELERKLGVSWDESVKLSQNVIYQMGIVSLTPHWNNTLMWAHYADKFNGFCIGFEFDNPLYIHSKIGESFTTYRNRAYYKTEYWLDEIIYANQDAYPTAASFHFDDIEEEMPEACLRFKASDWRYEHECRLSFLGGQGVHPVPGIIKEVYFGLRMKEEEKRVLTSITTKYNPVFYDTRKSETHIKIVRTAIVGF